MKVLTAIPVYNEERHLENVLAEVRRYSPNILVVNDGSPDRTGELLARQSDVTVITHPKNCGYGAALAAGDHEGFRSSCTQLAGLVTDGKDARTDRLAAAVCSLSADSVEDLEVVLRSARVQADQLGKTSGDLAVLGAVLLRHGRAVEAETVLLKAREARGGEGAYEELLMTLACHELGRSDEARRWLAAATACLDRPKVVFQTARASAVLNSHPLVAVATLATARSKPQSGLWTSPSWEESLDLDLLRREGEATLRVPPR